MNFEQLLQLRNLRHARAAEGFERIVGEAARARVAANHAAPIVGGVARKAHRARLHAAHAGAEGVFLAHRAGNDLLVIHPHIFEEVLGQVGAVEADALVGMAAVVVVPVEQRRRCPAGQRQHIHAQRAGHVHFAGRRNQVVAHHAHDGAGHHAEELFHRGPALHGADRHMRLLHPSVDHRAQLGHLQQRRVGNAGRGDILLDRGQLGLRRIVVVLHAIDAPEDLRQIDRLDRDAAGLKDALGVADGVEGRRTRANGADAQILQPLHNAANLRRTTPDPP